MQRLVGTMTQFSTYVNRFSTDEEAMGDSIAPINRCYPKLAFTDWNNLSRRHGSTSDLSSYTLRTRLRDVVYLGT